MGMPGFSGFVAELQVLVGAWQAFPILGLVTGVGILLGIAYIIRAVQKAFFGVAVSAPPQEASVPLSPISVPEKVGALILIVATVVVGIYPKVLLGWIAAGFNTPLMAPLTRGGGG